MIDKYRETPGAIQSAVRQTDTVSSKSETYRMKEKQKDLRQNKDEEKQHCLSYKSYRNTHRAQHSSLILSPYHDSGAGWWP